MFGLIALTLAVGGTTVVAQGGTRLIPVTLAAFQSSFVNFPIYVADGLGLFQKHGLDIKIIYGTGAQVTNALVSRSVEFAGFSVESGLAVAAKGQDIKFVALNQTASPFTLIVRKEVPLPHKDAAYPENLKDLKGLRLGVSTLGASSDNTLRFLLKQAGLDPDRDVKIIPVGDPGTQVAALARRQIDGTIAFEPIQSQAIFGLGIAKPVLDLEAGQGPEVFRDYAYNAVATRGDYIRSNREAVLRMRDAIVDAEKFINRPENLDALVSLSAKYMEGIPTRVLRLYLRQYYTIFRPVITEKALSNVNRVLIESGRIQTPVPYDQVVAVGIAPTTFDPTH